MTVGEVEEEIEEDPLAFLDDAFDEEFEPWNAQQQPAINLNFHNQGVAHFDFGTSEMLLEPIFTGDPALEVQSIEIQFSDQQSLYAVPSAPSNPSLHQSSHGPSNPSPHPSAPISSPWDQCQSEKKFFVCQIDLLVQNFEWDRCQGHIRTLMCAWVLRYGPEAVYNYMHFFSSGHLVHYGKKWGNLAILSQFV